MTEPDEATGRLEKRLDDLQRRFESHLASVKFLTTTELEKRLTELEACLRDSAGNLPKPGFFQALGAAVCKLIEEARK